MRKLLEQLAVTAELMGQQISPTALSVMAQDLSRYPQEIVLQALTNLRRESKYRMTLAAVIEQIERLQPDGRPGADEAWAMIPQDEAGSVVWTQEMAEAYGIACHLLDDRIAARMAFKEAYNRIVDSNKRNGIQPTWAPSLGHDKDGREAALAEAVRLGRIGTGQAIKLIPPEQVAPMLQSAGEEKLALEYKLLSADVAFARIQAIKDSLRKKVAA